MLESLLANGISVVHADFKEEHAAFYKECGFRIGPGGIYERRK
jgi:hypothetical protein